MLAVLSVLLKTAVEWELVKHLPCAIRLLAVERQDAAFHYFNAYERLLQAARSIDRRTYVSAIQDLTMTQRYSHRVRRPSTRRSDCSNSGLRVVHLETVWRRRRPLAMTAGHRGAQESASQPTNEAKG